MPHGLLFDRGVIHGESTKGFAYTFGKKTSPGFPTDGPRVPHPSGPGEVRAWGHRLGGKSRRNFAWTPGHHDITKKSIQTIQKSPDHQSRSS